MQGGEYFLQIYFMFAEPLKRDRSLSFDYFKTMKFASHRWLDHT